MRLCPPIAKASCVSQILTADAVMHDMGERRAVETGVRTWAKCNLKHSERDAHRTMKKQGTKLAIPVGEMSCDGCNIPWISPETWLKFVVDKGLWPLLAGCDRFDSEGARQNWSAFWTNYEKVCPNFELFQMSDVDLSRTAAWFIHGDEGRTLKRGGMLITSLQSALGSVCRSMVTVTLHSFKWILQDTHLQPDMLWVQSPRLRTMHRVRYSILPWIIWPNLAESCWTLDTHWALGRPSKSSF